MAFDLDDAEREQPRWIEYKSGRVAARFLVAPRDVAKVRELNQRYGVEQRFTRGGRVVADPKAAEKNIQWMREYLLHHVKDWDITKGGQKAPITAESLVPEPGQRGLTDGMQAYILEATGADDLRDFESPLAASSNGPQPAPAA
jgi:hypothetical protein